MRGDLAIAGRGELATQELDRRTMLGGRTLLVDNPDPRSRLQGGREIVEEGVGFCDLVIHVHEDRCIERGRRQPRIVRLAERKLHIAELQLLGSLRKLSQALKAEDTEVLQLIHTRNPSPREPAGASLAGFQDI